MTAIYRVPLWLDTPGPTWIEDLDLPLLLNHDGQDQPDPVSELLACGLIVQMLPSARPSALAGQRCCTVVLTSSCPVSEATLTVVAGPRKQLPPELAAELQRVEAVALVGLKPLRSLAAFAAELQRAEAVRQQDADGVHIKETENTLEVTIANKPFFTYQYNTKDPELRRPIFHPVHGPSGKSITQLGEVPGKKVAHFHHTALWIAHQNWTAMGHGNLDNWQMNKNCTKIEHVKFDKIESGPLAARFIEQLSWLDGKGEKVLLAETRTVTVPKREAASRVIDIDLSLKAQDLPVTLNKTPYHLLACRVLDAMLPKNGGAMLNSEGKKNPPDGAPAHWIDVSGKFEDEEQGIALFNHPKNDRQPVPCLQFSGQTIGLSPTHKEPLTIAAGKEARFRFRALVHVGNAETAKVAAEYEAYAKGSQAKIGGVEKLRG
ncbi:MAG: PmoA family protein [Planctomycetia bacterium]|nr:PmoA family protein [Planctomycetia bacterium]